MKKILAVIIIASILLIGSASAEEIPVMPESFYGTALTNNNTAIPAGTEITAQLNGETFTYTIKETGKIGQTGTFGEKFIISPSDKSANGKTITFKIGSVQASQTAIFESGASSQLELKFPIEAQTSGSKKDIITEPPIIISETTIPPDFSLKVEDVTETKKAELPQFSAETKIAKIIEITPENPPAGDYTVILTITLTASEISSLGVTKEKIVVLHHNEAQNKWDELRTEIKSINADGSVTYSVWADGFSAFAIGTAPDSPTSTPTAAPTSSSGTKSGGGGGYSGGSSSQQTYTNYPTEVQTQQTVKPASTPSYTPQSQPMPTATKTPVQLIGLLAGLACAVMIRRK